MVFFLVLCYLIVSETGRVVKWGDFAHRGVISFRLLCCEYSLCEGFDESESRVFV